MIPIQSLSTRFRIITTIAEISRTEVYLSDCFQELFSFDQKDRSQTGFSAFLYKPGGQASRIRTENNFQSIWRKIVKEI